MLTEPASAAQFVAQIHSAIAHWQGFADDLDQDAIRFLDQEKNNLYHLLRFALRSPQTCTQATTVALSLSPFIEQQGYWREWIPILEKATAVASDIPTQLRLRNQIGLFCRLNNDLQKAIAVHQQVMHDAKAISERTELAHAYFHLGVDFYHVHNYEKGMHFGKLALQYFSKTPEMARGGTAPVSNLFGLIALNKGEYKRAQKHFFQALAQYKVAGEDTYVIRSLLNIARTYEGMKKFESALAFYQKADDLLEPISNKIDEISIQVNRGTVYVRLKKWQVAQKVYLEIDIDYLQRAGYLFYHAMVLTNLGFVFLRQNKLNEAVDYLREAVALWEQTDAGVMRANALGTLAEAICRQGDRPTAMAYFEKAITLLENHPDDKWANSLWIDFTQQKQELL